MDKKPRHPKLGYFINAAKKRKQKQQSSESKSEKRTKSSDATPVPPVEQLDSEAPSDSEIESPSYSPLTHYDPSSESDANQSTMDIDVNAHTDADNVGSSAGGESSNSRMARSIGEGKANSNGGGMRGVAPLPRGVRQEPMRTLRKYRKQYLLRVQNELIETGYLNAHNTISSGDTGFRYGLIRYPFHDLPVNMLGFYLSKSEMAELSQYTKATVKHVKVDVFNKTGVINYETAASTTAIGNNNIGIYLVELSRDLNYKRTGQLPQQSILIEEVFWGYPYADFNSASSTDFTSENVSTLGAQYVRRTLNNKFEYASLQLPDINVRYNTIMGTKLSTPAIPYFDVWPFVDKRINASMNEGFFTTYEYSPVFGTVFAQQMGQAGSEYLELNNTRMPLWSSSTGGTEANPYKGSLPGLYNTGGQTAEVETREPLVAQKFPFINPKPRDYSMLEIENAAGNLVRRKPIPPLVLGIEPLTSELKTQGKWEAVQCHVDILVQVELDMEIIMGTDYTNPNTFDIRRPDFKNPELQVYVDTTAIGSNDGAARWVSNGNQQIPNNQSYATNAVVLEDRCQTSVTLTKPTSAYTTSKMVLRSHLKPKSGDAIELEALMANDPTTVLRHLHPRHKHTEKGTVAGNKKVT